MRMIHWRANAAHTANPMKPAASSVNSAPSDRRRVRVTAASVEAGRRYNRRAEGSSSIGRAPVSKTGGCRFESCLPCQKGPGDGAFSITGPSGAREPYPCPIPEPGLAYASFASEKRNHSQVVVSHRQGATRSHGHLLRNRTLRQHQRQRYPYHRRLQLSLHRRMG
jgi:hypothetical protein